MATDGNGNDTAHGGAAGGWTDTIQMQNVTGDYLTGDWTLNITSGSIQSTDGNSLTLSQDAEGTITTSDGSQLTFDGAEQIRW